MRLGLFLIFGDFEPRCSHKKKSVIHNQERVPNVKILKKKEIKIKKVFTRVLDFETEIGFRPNVFFYFWRGRIF